VSRETGPESSDRDLLDAHLAGDPDAFGVLFTRHRDRLWAVALRTTGNPEDAADALQDAMISAFRRAGSFRGDAAVTTWLHRIVVNACLDRLRRRKVRAADPLPDDLEEQAARGDVLATPAAADPAADVVTG
jgi:RNA polymerase sigma-70 factor (ECF subfamily)